MITRKPTLAAPISPLYTSPAYAAAKAAVILAKGKDSDGAYRVSLRLDEQEAE